MMNTMTHLAATAALVGTLSLISGSALADQRMFDDFLHGNTQKAVEYIESGGDLKVRDKNGMSLLHWAAWAGEIEIAKRLLEQGMDVDVPSDPDRTTPLMQASMGGQPEMVAFLLKSGADPRRATEIGFTALHFWVKSGSPDVLDSLLVAGTDPLAKVSDPSASDHGFTALDGVRKHSPALLKTDAGRRLQRLTYEATGCEGVIVLASDKKLTILAERTLGRESRWREIAELNGLGPDKGYRKGDCLKLP